MSLTLNEAVKNLPKKLNHYHVFCRAMKKSDPEISMEDLRARWKDLASEDPVAFSSIKKKTAKQNLDYIYELADWYEKYESVLPKDKLRKRKRSDSESGSSEESSGSSEEVSTSRSKRSPKRRKK
eukprot:TRINITY_DN7029_c0_g1_i1.p1 TRINITY_DN7029_c0_g1~~TRINITY_DN7029_c0_g1_i1.p1  ORF type:complete len:125 (+),score=21.11 TRINITY_DN7029_c0_g1_i1:73-447(+)